MGKQFLSPQTHLLFRTTSIYPPVSAPKGIRRILHGPRSTVKRRKRGKGDGGWEERSPGSPSWLGVVEGAANLLVSSLLSRGDPCRGASLWATGTWLGKDRLESLQAKTFRPPAATLQKAHRSDGPRSRLSQVSSPRPAPAPPSPVRSRPVQTVAAAAQLRRARARGSLRSPARGAGLAARPLPGGRVRGPSASLLPLAAVEAASRAERAAGARAPAPPPPLSPPPRLPPPIPPSLPLSEHSMSERSEDDVGAFSNPVSLGCCCRRNREKATRRKSNGDTGSQSAQSGGVSGQTLVLLDRRRQITLLRQ